MLLLTSQLARKSMQLVYFSTWNTASGRSVCNIDIALQARGCWKWQGSILYPSSKTMDRLSVKWEEDSTNCWTRMEENGTIWQGSMYKAQPYPTPCYYIQGRFCLRILHQEIQLWFANRYSDQVGHACHINFLQSLITNFYHYWYKKCWVGSSSSPIGWSGDGGGLYQPSVNLKLRLFCLSLAFYHTYRSRRWHLCISFISASRECNPPLPEKKNKKKKTTHKRETLKYCMDLILLVHVVWYVLLINLFLWCQGSKVSHRDHIVCRLQVFMYPPPPPPTNSHLPKFNFISLKSSNIWVYGCWGSNY